MVGKFLLIALVSVSLAQVRGEELEAAIEKGLEMAKTGYETGRDKIDAAIAAVRSTSENVDSKNEEFVQKAVGVQDGARQEMRNVAADLEEKSKESDRLQSILDCIKKYEDNANKQIESLTNKFKADMERVRRVKQENIKTDSKPLDGMQDALKVRYDRAVKDIKNCKNPQCVVTDVNSFNTWLDSTYAVIKRVDGQISKVVSNFERDGNNNFENTNVQVNRIKNAAITDMKICADKKK